MLTLIANQLHALGYRKSIRRYRFIVRTNYGLNETILTYTVVCKALELTHPAVNKSLRKLEEMDIVKEITGRQRNRLYMYESYMNILNEGLEPI